MFRFTVTGLPSPATFWIALFTIGGQDYPSGLLRRGGEFWECYASVGSGMQVPVFSVWLYDDGGNYLGPSYAKSLYYGAIVADGADYEFNFTTNQFRGVSQKGEFRNFSVTVDKREVNFGDSFIITFHFQYRGPANIGTIGLKVALGKKWLTHFDEVEPSWLLSTSLTDSSSWVNFNKPISCTVPKEGASQITSKTYDISCEIGNYPWNDRVFDNGMWRQVDYITILSEGDGDGVAEGFKELTASIKKA